MTKTLVVGLTGGIAMGKSTVAGMIRRLGIPVFDADATVRRLQAPGCFAHAAIVRRLPGVARLDGTLNRSRLRAAALGDAATLTWLEALMHPLVYKEQERFVRSVTRNGARLAVVDVPLLLETGGQSAVDRVLVVSAPKHVQRTRVLQRGLSPDEYVAIVGRQFSESKRRDWVHRAGRDAALLPTGLSRHLTRVRLRRILRTWHP